MPTVGGLALADNPFINRDTSPVGRSPSSYGTVLPWQAAPAGVAAGVTTQGEPAAGSETVAQQSQILHDVDTMMDSLQEKPAAGVRAWCRCAGVMASRA